MIISLVKSILRPDLIMSSYLHSDPNRVNIGDQDELG
jgi:hypothetical protein